MNQLKEFNTMSLWKIRKVVKSVSSSFAYPIIKMEGSQNLSNPRLKNCFKKMRIPMMRVKAQLFPEKFLMILKMMAALLIQAETQLRTINWQESSSFTIYSVLTFISLNLTSWKHLMWWRPNDWLLSNQIIIFNANEWR